MKQNMEQERKDWIKTAKEKGASYIVVWSDNFSYEYYPVYVNTQQEVDAQYAKVNNNLDTIKDVIFVGSAEPEGDAELIDDSGNTVITETQFKALCWATLVDCLEQGVKQGEYKVMLTPTIQLIVQLEEHLKKKFTIVED